MCFCWALLPSAEEFETLSAVLEADALTLTYALKPESLHPSAHLCYSGVTHHSMHHLVIPNCRLQLQLQACGLQLPGTIVLMP